MSSDGEGTTRGRSQPASLLRASGSMAVATATSRATGFLVKVALATVLGLGVVNDSFIVATTFPALITQFLLGGLLSSVVVPLLVRAQAEDSDGGRAYTEKLITISVLVLGTGAVLAVAGAPLLTEIFVGSGADAATQPLATALSILILPQILFLGLFTLFQAILNTKGYFGLPAWAPVLNNIVLLAVLLVYLFTPGSIDTSPVSLTDPKLLLLGLGSTSGIVVQALVLLPALRRAGIRWRPRWGWDARLNEAGGLAAWVFGYVILGQVGVLMISRTATAFGDGTLTVYQYAWLLVQVPYGIIGVSLLTALMPRMSRAAAGGDHRRMLSDLSFGARMAVVGLMPIAVIMTVLGPQIGLDVFSFGAASDARAVLIGHTLAISAFGLIPYALSMLQTRSFYAIKDARTPTLIMAVIVGSKIALLLSAPAVFDPGSVVLGLALANALSYVVGAVISQLMLRRALGAVHTPELLRTLGLSGIAAVFSAGVLMLVLGALRLVDVDPTGSVAVTWLLTLLLAPLALLVQFLVSVALAMPEIDYLMERVSHRFPRWLRRGLIRLRGGRSSLGQIEDVVAHSGQRVRRRQPVEPSVLELTMEMAALGTQDYQLSEGAPPALAWQASSVHHERQGQRRGPPPPPGGDAAADGQADDRAAGRARRSVSDSGEHHAHASKQGALVAGANLAGGRYRLLAEADRDDGGNTRLWRARDTALGRDVGLTMLCGNSHDRESILTASRVLERTLHLGRFSHPSIARILDVLGLEHLSGPGEPSGVLGVVISDWVRGTGLVDVLDEGTIDAETTIEMLDPLAGAVHQAHNDGLVLGVDRPQRLRLTPEGALILAFPGTRLTAAPPDDVRGLSAQLYLCLTGHWPLAEGPERLPAAPQDARGGPVPPDQLEASVPEGLSTIVSRGLAEAGAGGVRTGAAIQRGLRDVAARERRLAERRAEERSGTARQGWSTEAPPVDQRRRRRLRWALLALAAVTVLLLGWLGNRAVGTFTGASDDEPPPVVVSDTTVPPSSTPPSTPEPTSAPPAPVTPTGASVFIVEGDPDHPDETGNVLDGDPATTWSTYTYEQPFPALKPGVGLMIDLEQPAAVGNVAIDSPTPGTTVEIRSAPNPDVGLDAAPVVAQATLQVGRTEIPIDEPQQSGAVLVWITALGPGNISEIGEISMQPPQ